MNCFKNLLMAKIRLCLILLLSINSMFLKAQQNCDSIVYLHSKVNNFGIGRITLQNNFISPLIHSGVGFQVNSASFKEIKHALWNNYSTISAGSLINRANNYSLIYVGYNNDFSYLFNLNKCPSKNFKIKAGLSGNVLIDLIYKPANINNQSAYKVSANIGGALFLSYKVVKLKNIEIGNLLTFPLAGVMSLSSYGKSLPDYDHFISNIVFSNWSKNKGFNNNLFIDIKSKSISKFINSSWRIGYNVNYSAQPNPNNQKILSGIFYIGRIVNIYN